MKNEALLILLFSLDIAPVFKLMTEYWMFFLLYPVWCSASTRSAFDIFLENDYLPVLPDILVFC